MDLPLGRLAVIAIVMLAVGVVWFLFASIGSQAPTSSPVYLSPSP